MATLSLIAFVIGTPLNLVAKIRSSALLLSLLPVLLVLNDDVPDVGRDDDEVVGDLDG